MKWSNQIENRLLILGSMSITVFVMWIFFRFMILPTFTTQIENQNKLIEKLAAQEKYKIENDFGRMKAKDGQIILDLNNNLDIQKIETSKIVNQDSVPKRFFRQLFSKKNDKN